MLLATLTSVAENGEATIGRLPDELTSTVAADILSVSRPTLMKWVRQGRIDSFKVGTHTRFKREDVLRLQAERMEERRAAFAAGPGVARGRRGRARAAAPPAGRRRAAAP